MGRYGHNNAFPSKRIFEGLQRFSDRLAVFGCCRDDIVGDLEIFDAAVGEVGPEERMSEREGAGSGFEVDEDQMDEYDGGSRKLGLR